MLKSGTKPKEAWHIWIVDDDEDDQLFLRSAIAETLPGTVISSLYDGSQAVDLLQGKSKIEDDSRLPDLIFLDINMNRLCGQKTTEILKKDLHVQHIPIIILTTASSTHQRQELLAAGANDFYTKPYNISDLKVIVKEVSQKWLPVFKVKR